MTDADVSLPAPPRGGGRNLPVAIAVGIGLLSAFAVGLIWAHWFFVLLTAVALSLCVVELHRALLLKGMKSSVVPVVVGTAASVLGSFLVAEFGLGAPTGFGAAVIGATVIAAFCWRLGGGVDGFLRDMSATAFIIAYIPVMGLFISLLLVETHGALRFLAIILCVVASDTGAYLTGSLIGRHKMAPHISPAKTWEGFAGGMVLTALVGAGAAVWFLGLPWWAGAILGVAVSPAATLGDLVESLIKRDAGIKDMSNFLPGHGGVMDRLDSMLVAIPVGWMILHLALGN